MTTHRRPGVGLVLISALVSAACNPQAKPPAQPPPTVTVARPLVREVVDWDEYIGHLKAVEEVQLRARVGGYLEEANFKEGSVIEKGTVLFKLDPKPYQAELERALAQVEQAKAQAENAAAEFTRIERLRKEG